MPKFHISKDGQTKPCTASARACPLGEANHFDSVAEAAAYAASPRYRADRAVEAQLAEWKEEYEEAVRIFNDEHEDGDGYEFAEALSITHPNHPAFDSDIDFSNSLAGLPVDEADHYISVREEALRKFGEWEADQA